MGDLLGSLIQGSQKRTILCVIGVGCYSSGEDRGLFWGVFFCSEVQVY
jgi:hypothetical protein